MQSGGSWPCRCWWLTTGVWIGSLTGATVAKPVDGAKVAANR